MKWKNSKSLPSKTVGTHYFLFCASHFLYTVRRVVHEEGSTQQIAAVDVHWQHFVNKSRPGASPGQSKVPMFCLLTAANIKRGGKPEARTDLVQGGNETTSGSN